MFYRKIFPMLKFIWVVFNLISFSSIVLGQEHNQRGIHKKGIHKFPAVDIHGNQIANEFQLIRPESIQSLTPEAVAKYGFKMITSVSPLVISNDEIITVNYSSFEPYKADWIGAYSPAINASQIKSTVPVKYGWCDDDPNYYAHGYGSMQFNMTNLRANISFFMFSSYYNNEYGDVTPTTTTLYNSSSTIVNFDDINQPLRPRVVPTGDYNVLNLLWSSATSQRPMLKWGTTSKSYNHNVSADTSTIEKAEICGAPANGHGYRSQGLIHNASFVGTAKLASQKIYYVFGDAATNLFSSEHVLLVPPLAGQQPPTRPTTVILYDDLGRGSTDDTYTWNEYGRPSIFTAMSVGAQVAAGEIDAIYHGGDISYATGYLAVWDFFLDMISPMASGVIYLTTVGNHESDWPHSPSYYQGTDSGGECGVLSTNLIPLPSPAVTNAPWWSYDVGLIHFVGISTEHNFTIGSLQYKWLENDLRMVNRTITPWIIFGGHRAMYINSNYCCEFNSDITVMNLMIANLEPLLWKYRVNIGFYGHNHVVQRHSAVYNKTVVQQSKKVVDSDGNVTYVHENPQATVHMVIGTGGASFTVNAVTPSPAWNELFFYQWGYARVTAVNVSYLDWQWINNANNDVMDHMVIIQTDPSEPWVLPPPSSPVAPLSPTTTSPSGAVASTATGDDDTFNDLSPGAIAGIAIGTAVIFITISALVGFSYKKFITSPAVGNQQLESSSLVQTSPLQRSGGVDVAMSTSTQSPKTQEMTAILHAGVASI